MPLTAPRRGDGPAGHRAARALAHLAAPALLGLVAIVTRRHWLGADLATLVEGVLPDDAFYYSEIAWRIWHDGEVSFDGTTPATGLHPLWLWLVTPLYRGASPGAVRPLHLTLLLGSGLAVLAALEVVRFARRATGQPGLAIAIGVLFLGNLWVVRETLNGLETALALLLVALLAGAVGRYLDHPGIGAGLSAGFLAALAILARSDSALIVLPLGLVCLFASGLSRSLLALALPPVLAVGGLTLWSLAATGELLQSSAVATPWLVRFNWNRLHGFAPTLAQVHEYGLTQLADTLRSARELLGDPAVAVLLVASAIVLGGVLAGPSRLGPRATASGRVALALAAGLLLLHVAHAYVRWFPRSWYFAGWGLVTAMMAGAAATVVGRLAGRDDGPIPKGGVADRPPAPSPALRVVAWVMLAALLAVVGLDLERTVRLGAQPRYSWQRELLLAGLGLADHVPPGEPVGSFNAAIIGYASARTVVNLDGVVNAAAGRSMRQGRLGAYMAERGIRFLVDYPATWGYAHFRYTLGPLMGREFADAPREVVARFDVPGVGWPDPDAAVLLLRIDWRGAPRASP